MKPLITQRLFICSILFFSFFSSFALGQDDYKELKITESNLKSALKAKVEDFEGKSFTLSDSKAKARIVLFWAGWCPPCQKAFKDLSEANDEFVKNEIEIFAISTDESEDEKNKAKDLVGQYKTKFKNGFVNKHVWEAFETKTIPAFWFLSSDGKVKKVIIGYVSITKIKRDLNELFSLKLLIPEDKK